MGEIKVGELGDLEEIEMRDNDGGKEDRRSDLFVYESVDELNFWGWFVLGVVKLNAALEGSGGWRRGRKEGNGRYLSAHDTSKIDVSETRVVMLYEGSEGMGDDERKRSGGRDICPMSRYNRVYHALERMSRDLNRMRVCEIRK